MSTKQALADIDLDDEFGPVGGINGNSTVIYMTFNEPKVPSNRTVVWQPGKEAALIGELSGSYVDEKYGHTKYKLRTETGTVVLPSATQLNKRLSEYEDGTRLRIVYQGKGIVSKGPRAGKEAHGFAITASRFQQNG